MKRKQYFAAVGYGNQNMTPNFLVFWADQSGKMHISQEFYCDGGPSYLITKPGDVRNSVFVYAALERKNEIAVYKWEQNNLSEIGRWAVPGEGLCHLSLSKEKTYIYGSCYMSGDFFAVDSNTGKCIWRQTGGGKSHAHCIYQGKNRFYTVDLGMSQIQGYFFNNGKIRNKSIEFLTEEEEGPRQLLTWNSEQYAAIVNECSSTLSFWKLHQKERALSERLCTVNTTYYTKNNAPGDAVIWKERVLFVGNRGAETISAFSLKKIGEKIGEWDCGGRYPRGLFLSETGTLFAACQKSGTIISFYWNETDSRLEICDSLRLPGAAGVIELTAEERCV